MANFRHPLHLVYLLLFNLLVIIPVNAYPALPKQENKLEPIMQNANEMMRMQDDSTEKMMHDLFSLMRQIENSYKLTFDMNGMFRKLWAEISASNPYLERKFFYDYANPYLAYWNNSKILYYYYGEDVQQYYHVVQQGETKPVPVRLRWGINIGLTGLFIAAIPTPMTQATGSAICMAGTMMCVDSLATIQQEREDEAERQKAGR